jgi:Uma2 family endonuclease
MTISDARKMWSDADLLALPKDGCKREVVGGELVTMSPAGFNHGAIVLNLSGELWKVVKATGIGVLVEGQTGFRLASGDLFSPDIAFVSKDRAAAHDPAVSAFFQGAPDFFVEVLSPSDSFQVLREKLEQFFKEGTRLAWIVDPKRRCVYVHRSAETSTTLQQGAALDGEDVIPGFHLPLAQLFV